MSFDRKPTDHRTYFMEDFIEYKPTPDSDNIVINKWLKSHGGDFIDLMEFDPIVDKFKGKQTFDPFWHSGIWIDYYIDNGEVCGGYWDFGGFQCSDDFLKKLEQHPVIRDNVFTGVWIDESVAYGTMNKPKKQHKQKHKVPYWVKDWRKK